MATNCFIEVRETAILLLSIKSWGKACLFNEAPAANESPTFMNLLLVILVFAMCISSLNQRDEFSSDYDNVPHEENPDDNEQ